VPTVIRRRPGRLVPLPVSNDTSENRRSCSLRPLRAAASAMAGTEPSRLCSPVATSRPASSASTITATQCSGSTPPALTTPTTMVRAPASTACAIVMSGIAQSALQPGSRTGPSTTRGANRRRHPPFWRQADQARLPGTGDRVWQHPWGNRSVGHAALSLGSRTEHIQHAPPPEASGVACMELKCNAGPGRLLRRDVAACLGQHDIDLAAFRGEAGIDQILALGRPAACSSRRSNSLTKLSAWPRTCCSWP
jgi:hypothetical protein